MADSNLTTLVTETAVKFNILLTALFGSCVMSAAAADNSVVRIGVSNDRSGIYADLGGLGSEVAARMAVEDFGGEVLGKKIEVIGGDTQNKVDIAGQLVRSWFDTKNLVAVVDGGASSTGLAAAAIAREKNKAALISGGFAADFAGAQCAETTTQWAPDTYALAKAVVRSNVQAGAKSWYFVTTDYIFGKTLEKNASEFINQEGGKVVGSVRHPLGALDFSSFLLQAQASGADMIGLASAGGDLVNLAKQSQEFGLTTGKQKLATFLTFINDVDGMGLDVAKGLVFPTAFYWDTDEDTRAWTRRWQQKSGFKRAPSVVQALTYVSVSHYLNAVKAAGSFDGDKATKAMSDLPIGSKLIKNARVRPEDGRVIMDLALVQVKTPQESKAPYDYYKVLSTIPGDEAFVSLADSACPRVKKS